MAPQVELPRVRRRVNLTHLLLALLFLVSFTSHISGLAIAQPNSALDSLSSSESGSESESESASDSDSGSGSGLASGSGGPSGTFITILTTPWCNLIFIDICPNDCTGNGYCQNGQCICKNGFSGPDCSVGSFSASFILPRL